MKNTSGWNRSTCDQTCCLWRLCQNAIQSCLQPCSSGKYHRGCHRPVVVSKGLDATKSHREHSKSVRTGFMYTSRANTRRTSGALSDSRGMAINTLWSSMSSFSRVYSTETVILLPPLGSAHQLTARARGCENEYEQIRTSCARANQTASLNSLVLEIGMSPSAFVAQRQRSTPSELPTANCRAWDYIQKIFKLLHLHYCMMHSLQV